MIGISMTLKQELSAAFQILQAIPLADLVHFLVIL